MRAITICGTALLFIFLVSYKIPEGWFAAGSKPDAYEMGTDPGAGQDGANAATIKSVSRKINGFGTLMQNIDAENYKGKRLRMTGYVKAEDVESWAGLWMRVDGRAASKTISTTVKNHDDSRKVVSKVTSNETKVQLAFDNMYNRPIKGTAGWTKCEVVLDVADTAVNIAFGALLHGTGQIWFDKLKFDVVGNDVPTTNSKPKNPENLDFEK